MRTTPHLGFQLCHSLPKPRWFAARNPRGEVKLASEKKELEKSSEVKKYLAFRVNVFCMSRICFLPALQ